MQIGKFLDTEDLVTASFENVYISIQHSLTEEQLACLDCFFLRFEGPLLDPNIWTPLLCIFCRYEDVALNERRSFIADGAICTTIS
jgi:hypothetical protein